MAADDSLGPVRPYVLTGGRTEPTRRLERHSLVAASSLPPKAPLGPNQAKIVDLCRGQFLSVHEVAARLYLPIQVAKIWVSDLLDQRYLVVPPPTGFTTDPTDPDLLRSLLAALKRL